MSIPDCSTQITEAFNLLRKGLRPFVEDQMKIVVGDQWYDECHHAGVYPNREGRYTWDIQALLKVVTNAIFWRDVFAMAKRRGAEERGIFITLLELRHEVDAHRDNDMSRQQAQRVLKYVVDALKCIDAKDQAEEAERLLQSITPGTIVPPATPVPFTVSAVPPVIPMPPSVASKPASILSEAPIPISISEEDSVVEPLQTGRTIDFWGTYHFDFADALNEDIWQLSPVVQQEIQPSSTLKRPGVIGAQQAMLDSPLPDGREALPWIPDLVGKQWRDADALVIVGSAYAGFIREYSTRNAAIPLSQYATSSVQDFQSLFLRYVVSPDLNYYGPLRNLCSEFGSAARLSLMDLCRVSLVKRGTGTTKRMDSSSGIVREDPAIYEKYVEGEQPSEWLWRRFAEGRAQCVLALGQTCEHGLLRLFHRRGMTITQDEEPFFVPPIAHGAWANEYADPNRKLGYWLNHKTWWTIRGQVDGMEKVWRVLPVYHPSSHQNYDAGYSRTKEVLTLMQACLGD